MDTKQQPFAETDGLLGHSTQAKPRTWKTKAIRGVGVITLVALSYGLTRTIIQCNHQPLKNDIPIPSDISLNTCDTWIKHPGWFWQRSTAKATFSFPTNATNMLILSRGWDSGRIRLVDGYDGEDARVEVHATYGRGVVLENHLRTCTITRGEGETGMGFFAPPTWESDADFEYVATVYLPTSGRTTPLHIPKLETDLTTPDLWIHFSELVEFDDVVFKSDNRGARALGSIRTKHARFNVERHSVTGNIEIRSNSSHEYHFQNGPSDYAHVKLSVESPPGGSAADWIGLNKTFAQTLRLSSGMTPEMYNGSFVFEVSSPEILEINVAYDFPQRCSPWSLYSCQSDLEVVPPVTFGGSFNITSAHPAKLHFDGNPDPTGTGRSRNVVVDGVGSEKMTGRVEWDKPGFDFIQLEVDTNLHPSVWLQ